MFPDEILTNRRYICTFSIIENRLDTGESILILLMSIFQISEFFIKYIPALSLATARHRHCWDGS